MSLNTDVVFVSGDKKLDWVYSDKQKNPISARRELVEEFYLATEGKDFVHLSPKDFIAQLNPSVSEDIIKDLSKSTRILTKIQSETEAKLTHVINLLYTYSMIGVSVKKESKYTKLAREILELLESPRTELELGLQNVLLNHYDIDYIFDEDFGNMERELYEFLNSLY